MLVWLNPDREAAGSRYEEIRRNLVNFFNWRGCREAEDLADETIDRVCRKAEALSPAYEGDPALYFYGVAKKVYQEYVKRAAPPAKWTPPPEPKSADYEREYECLEQCIGQLGREDRELILAYYQKEKMEKIRYRRDLARAAALEPNALRVKVHRIRIALQKCIARCLEQGSRETN